MEGVNMKFFNRVQNQRESLSIRLENQKKLPITQEDLAKAVGCSRVMIWKIENGTSPPGVTLALKICKALSCEPWDIFPIEHSPTPFIQTKPPPPKEIDPSMAKMIEQFGLGDEAWKLT
jgi:DNA-binding XRE family transcriptional regulator